jgi:hypothetical protein
MKIFSSLFLLMLMSAAFLACQKESDSNGGQSNADHLTSSVWVYQSSGVDVDRNGTIDQSLEDLGVPSCNLDNTLKFEKNGTATADEGATKCDAADPQSTTFNWNFADDEKSLEIRDNVFSDLNGKFNIKTLNNTTLTLTKDTTITAPISLSVSVIVNLKH